MPVINKNELQYTTIVIAGSDNTNRYYSMSTKICVFRDNLIYEMGVPAYITPALDLYGPGARPPMFKELIGEGNASNQRG